MGPRPAKASRHWVVAPSQAPGVDAVSLGAALAKARDGDEIELRPGLYVEGAPISKSVTLRLAAGRTKGD